MIGVAVFFDGALVTTMNAQMCHLLLTVVQRTTWLLELTVTKQGTTEKRTYWVRQINAITHYDQGFEEVEAACDTGQKLSILFPPLRFRTLLPAYVLPEAPPQSPVPVLFCQR